MVCRLRTKIIFTLLLLALSVILISQSVEASPQSTTSNLVGVLYNGIEPFQATNATTSQTVSSTNSSTTNQANSTIVSAPIASPQTTNVTAALAGLQVQEASMSDQIGALSSANNALGQDANVAEWVSIFGIALAIFAIISAIAVSKRTDANFSDLSSRVWSYVSDLKNTDTTTQAPASNSSTIKPNLSPTIEKLTTSQPSTMTSKAPPQVAPEKGESNQSATSSTETEETHGKPENPAPPTETAPSRNGASKEETASQAEQVVEQLATEPERPSPEAPGQQPRAPPKPKEEPGKKRPGTHEYRAHAWGSKVTE